MLSGAIASAQEKVESRNFQSRKNVLEYDDVMNRQREIIYGQRMQVLNGIDLREQIVGMIDHYVSTAVVEVAAGHDVLEKLQAQQLATKFTRVFIPPEETTSLGVRLEGMSQKDATEYLKDRAMKFYEAKEQALGPQLMRELERVVLLRTVDQKWMDHIDEMHELRRWIGLNAYAQVDPIMEYKKQGFDMFDAMIEEVKNETARLVFIASVTMKREKVARETGTAGDGTAVRRPVRKGAKVGPNDPCPCGSGKKYKKCCMDKDRQKGVVR
jgi:preprotein translocase subunit SecA